MATVRTGPATIATQVSAGADGNLTSPRRVIFGRADRPQPARPVTVWNKTGNGNPIYVKINTSTDTDFGGSTDDGVGYFPINDGAAVDVSMGNKIAVQNVSFVTTDAGDDLDDVLVSGWLSK